MNIIELAKQAYLYSPCVVWTIEKSDTFVTTHEAVHDFAALVEAAVTEKHITAIQNIERKGGWITREDAIEAIRGTT
jgi:hypothetical protein